MLKMVATCPDETKDTLVHELTMLGCSNIKENYRSVNFEVTPELFYKVHLHLRTASRLLWVLRECSAKHKNMLFDQAKRIMWHEIFSNKKTFIVDGVPGDHGPEHMTGNQISKTIREAVQHCFQHFGQEAPRVDLQEPDVRIVCFIKGGKAIISVDTSGKSLHKRGYKNDRHPAPIKETLAASLLIWAGYDGTYPLLDPMCGSGTIPIEAAYIALNKAPLIHRKKGEFGFENLLSFDSALWRDIQDKCRLERLDAPMQPIYASDIESHFVKMAQDNALRARVEKHIQFSTNSFFDLKKPAPKGLLIANLPYGERLDKNKDHMLEFYKEIGDKLKADFSGWRAFFVCLEDSPYKFIGLKPSFKRSILNGSLKVKVLGFDLYKGSRKD